MTEDVSGYLGGDRHYIVTRKPSASTVWTYQIYRSRLEDYLLRADACVVVVGD